MAASDPLVERADALQYQFDSGPCLTAGRDQVTVRVDDIDGETRWPQWTAAVAELDLRAMLSVPLVTSGAAIGAIKVYSGQPAAYNARAERLLELFARQAAILLSNTPRPWPTPDGSAPNSSRRSIIAMSSHKPRAS
jgi:GAF domain-containing protein